MSIISELLMSINEQSQKYTDSKDHGVVVSKDNDTVSFTDSSGLNLTLSYHPEDQLLRVSYSEDRNKPSIKIGKSRHTRLINALDQLALEDNKCVEDLYNYLKLIVIK